MVRDNVARRLTTTVEYVHVTAPSAEGPVTWSPRTSRPPRLGRHACPSWQLRVVERGCRVRVPRAGTGRARW